MMDEIVFGAEMQAQIDRRTESGERIQLSPGRTVVGFDFSGANMFNSTLASVKFVSCQFDKADLHKCNFKGSHFIDCTFDGAMANESNFDEAIIEKSDLDHACFMESSFLGAKLIANTYLGTSLEAADMRDSSLMWGAFGGARTFANLTGANLRGSLLEFCNMWRVEATFTCFDGAKILHTSFRSADMYGASFDTTTLRGVSFQDASMVRAQFHATNLSDVTFAGANLASARLESCDLTGTGMEATVLEGTEFIGCSE